MDKNCFGLCYNEGRRVYILWQGLGVEELTPGSECEYNVQVGGKWLPMALSTDNDGRPYWYPCMDNKGGWRLYPSTPFPILES